jgi:RimJ/RimL family protein N-acetyltransferase
VKQIVLHQDRIIGEWVCARTGGYYTEGTAIGLLSNGRLIAGVLYDHYNGASIAMHVAGEGNWLTRDFLRICFHYPFEQLKVRKVIGMVSSANKQAQRFDEHLGFTLEATIKDAAPDGDLLLYSMTREQCRFFKGYEHGRKKFSPAGS